MSTKCPPPCYTTVLAPADNKSLEINEEAAFLRGWAGRSRNSSSSSMCWFSRRSGEEEGAHCNSDVDGPGHPVLLLIMSACPGGNWAEQKGATSTSPLVLFFSFPKQALGRVVFCGIFKHERKRLISGRFTQTKVQLLDKDYLLPLLKNSDQSMFRSVLALKNQRGKITGLWISGGKLLRLYCSGCCPTSPQVVNKSDKC